MPFTFVVAILRWLSFRCLCKDPTLALRYRVANETRQPLVEERTFAQHMKLFLVPSVAGSKTKHHNQLGRVYRLPCRVVITRLCNRFTHSGLVLMSNIYCSSEPHTGNRASLALELYRRFYPHPLGFGIRILMTRPPPRAEAFWRTDGGNDGL